MAHPSVLPRIQISLNPLNELGAHPSLGESPSEPPERPTIRHSTNLGDHPQLLEQRLHPLDPRPFHPVDIVAVSFYNSKDGKSPLSMFEYRRSQNPATPQQTSNFNAKSPGTSGTQDPMAEKAPKALDLEARQLQKTQNGDPSRNWLKDSEMLPRDVPGSRIFAASFDVRSTEPQNFQQIENAATELTSYLVRMRKDDPERPIIFVGHQYGCIVIQKALCRTWAAKWSRAEKNKVEEDTLDATAAVLFFANPPKTRRVHMAERVVTRRVVDECESDATPEIKRFPILDDQDRLDSLWEDFDSVSKKAGFFHVSFIEKPRPLSEAKSERGRQQDQLTPDPIINHGTGRLEQEVVISKKFGDVAKFSGPRDTDYRRISQLISRFFQTSQLLGFAATGQHGQAKVMIRSGVNVNLQDRSGDSALHVAVQENKVDMARLLLNRGDADISLCNEKGKTALHFAVGRCNEKMVRLLLANGADAQVEDYGDEENGDGGNPETPEDLANRLRNEKLSIATEKQKLKSLDEIVELFQHPPLTEGPSSKQDTPDEDRLPGLQPPLMGGEEACRKTEMVVTEIFFHEDEQKEYSLPITGWVYDFIYDHESKLEEKTKNAREGKGMREKHFARPLIRWYHLPHNNVAWVNDLFFKLGKAAPRWPERSRGGDLPHSRSIPPQATVSPDPHGMMELFMPYLSYESYTRQMERNRFIRRSFKAHEDTYWTMQRLRGREQPRMGKGSTDDTTWNQGREFAQYRKNQTFFYLETASDQFLYKNYDWENTKNARTSRSAILTPDGRRADTEDDDADSSKTMARTETIQSQENDDEEENVDGEEKYLIKAYLYARPSLHIRRTLDQSYYYMLQDTEKRDNTQVVSRWACRYSYREDCHNIMMVDQLWLWVIPAKNESEPDIVISSFPDREGCEPEKTMDDLQWSVLNFRRQQRNPIRCTDDLVSQIVATCSNIFDRSQQVDTLRFLHYFESTIGAKGNQEIELLENFRVHSQALRRLESLDPTHRNIQHARKLLFDCLFDIQEETKLLQELKDIRDEIKIVLFNLDEQLLVIKSAQEKLRKKKGKRKGRQQNSPPFCEEAERRLRTSIRDFRVMEEHAKEIHKALHHLLDLKQKQANVLEARSTRERAEEAAKQGKVMLLFTLVTIIFLPLSWLTSFFALNVDEFPTDTRTGDPSWSLHVVCGYLFGMSFAVIIPFCLLAFSANHMTSIGPRLLHDWMSYYAIRAIRGVSRLFTKKPADTPAETWVGQLAKSQNAFKFSSRQNERAWHKSSDETRLAVDRLWEISDHNDKRVIVGSSDRKTTLVTRAEGLFGMIPGLYSRARSSARDGMKRRLADSDVEAAISNITDGAGAS